MLSQPVHGWTDFQLEGTSKYSLSYVLCDIPFEWLDRAILGLEIGRDFFLSAYLEPGEFICTVSASGSRVDVKDKLTQISTEYSSVGMLKFCRYLHRDIGRYLDDWVSFGTASGLCAEDYEYRKNALIKKRDKLKELIDRGL